MIYIRSRIHTTRAYTFYLASISIISPTYIVCISLSPYQRGMISLSVKVSLVIGTAAIFRHKSTKFDSSGNGMLCLCATVSPASLNLSQSLPECEPQKFNASRYFSERNESEKNSSLSINSFVYRESRMKMYTTFLPQRTPVLY